MNNSFYGKTLENVRDRQNIKFFSHSDEKGTIKSHSELTFKRTKIFETFSAHHHAKQQITFNKPIYIGFSVLELSKLLMYEFYYDILQVSFW